jgi:hypothetical protein
VILKGSGFVIGKTVSVVLAKTTAFWAILTVGFLDGVSHAIFVGPGYVSAFLNSDIGRAKGKVINGDAAGICRRAI